jgi:hypothetical protein
MHNGYFLAARTRGLHFSLPDPPRDYTLSTELDWQSAGLTPQASSSPFPTSRLVPQRADGNP